MNGPRAVFVLSCSVNKESGIIQCAGCSFKQRSYIKLQLQGDPKQTDIFEIATTLLWVNSDKKSN